MSKSSSSGLTPCEKKVRGTVILSLKVPARTKQLAERIARHYSSRKLETVLAAFVADLEVAAERPGSWEYEKVTTWLRSHVWECEQKD